MVQFRHNDAWYPQRRLMERLHQSRYVIPMGRWVSSGVSDEQKWVEKLYPRLADGSQGQ